jgi:peptide/nickel transport system permease protein
VGRYVLKRLLYLAAILWALTVVVFGITQVLPGNVAKMIVGQLQDPQAIAAIEQKLGLHDPLPVQYWRWFTGVLHGDLGDSLVMQRPITPIVLDALRNTISLALISIVCVAVIGVGLGVLGAVHRGQWIDHAGSLLTFLGISVPEFFWGIVLILLFAGYFKLLPSTGATSFADNPAEWLRHLILPVVTVTFTLLAHVARQTRSSMLEVLHANYVRAARARGLPERVVVLRHALRNALLPTITVLTLDFGFLVGEIVVVETVFAYPGFGRLTVYAIQQRDLPLMQACIITVSAIYVLANLLADLLYAYFDPRIRYGTTGD